MIGFKRSALRVVHYRNDGRIIIQGIYGVLMSEREH